MNSKALLTMKIMARAFLFLSSTIISPMDERSARASSVLPDVPLSVQAEDDDACAICYDDFTIQGRGLAHSLGLPCGHEKCFHKMCIKIAVDFSRKCPFCRKEVSVVSVEEEEDIMVKPAV